MKTVKDQNLSKIRTTYLKEYHMRDQGSHDEIASEYDTGAEIDFWSKATTNQE